MLNTSRIEFSRQFQLVVQGLCDMRETQWVSIIQRIQADISPLSCRFIIIRIDRLFARQIIQFFRTKIINIIIRIGKFIH